MAKANAQVVCAQFGERLLIQTFGASKSLVARRGESRRAAASRRSVRKALLAAHPQRLAQRLTQRQPCAPSRLLELLHQPLQRH